MSNGCNTKSKDITTYWCSITFALDIIGGKWKPLILWHLKDCVLRFGELRRIILDVTQKMLTQQLRELEEDGLIDRYVYAQVPPKVEYTLTDHGRTVIPILEMISTWGNNLCNLSHAYYERLEDASKDSLETKY